MRSPLISTGVLAALILPLPTAEANCAIPDPTTPAVFSPFRTPSESSEAIFGDPDQPGLPFVMRIRELAGTTVPPHVHHFDENITVVKGTWYFGIGPRFVRSALHKLPPGSFVFVPKGTPMFGYSPEAVTVQVHGIGPFEQHFVDKLYTLTDSKTGGTVAVDPTKFRFHPHQLVKGPLGKGRIEEGFATGSLIQYVVARGTGAKFMAQEEMLRAMNER